MGSELIEAVRVPQSQSSSSSGKFFPPGFRFHPTDEELVLYYLKRKICRRSLKPDIIGEVDVYKWDPEELPGQSKLKTGDRQWFFFSPRDRKYPNGGRSSRATLHGYWKATGKDRTIKRNSCPVGIKKTLVYYQGRAPSGQRTDWVMHEYTMDEQELKRCQFAQGHYALYKIFKKSGPGPKNGEQYGAPFVEEEWVDDDCLDVEPLLVQKPDCLGVEPTRVDDSIVVREEEDMMLSRDILEFLNKIVDEPQILPPLPQINGGSHEQETPNSLLECSSSKVDAIGQRTPTESSNEPQPLVINGDFLEMDDLIDPQSAIRVEDLQFPEFDCLSEFEFYHDSTRFSELGTFGSRQFQSDDLDYRTENSGPASEVVNHHHEVHDELPISYDLWDHDHSSLTTAHKAVSHSSSGVVVEENPGEHESRVNQQCPEANMDDGTDSWFSSALWAFVDSVPTTPASASESSALLNRALERMSSFSRSKNINVAAAAAAAGGGGVKASSVSRSSRGIVYFSVLGVLFAILWVFVGTSIELLRGLVS